MEIILLPVSAMLCWGLLCVNWELEDQSIKLDSILKKLDEIVKSMEQLEALETTDIPPCIRVQQSIQKSTLRDDIEKDHLSKELFIKNAPKSIGGMIQVPVVIKKE